MFGHSRQKLERMGNLQVRLYEANDLSSKPCHGSTRHEWLAKFRSMLCFGVASSLLTTYGWPSSWNNVFTTRLGIISQGETKTESDFVLNWTSSDSRSSEQSFYVTVPANASMDVEVMCTANDAILHTQVAPYSLGFTDVPQMLPTESWTKIGTVSTGSSSTEFCVSMYYEKSPWVKGAYATYASLRLTCKAALPAPTIRIDTYGTNANSDYIKITWGSVSGASAYDIYRSETDTRPDSPLDTNVSSPYYDYKSSGLVAGTRYYYWVAARNRSGEVSYSNRDYGNIRETAQTYNIKFHRNYGEDTTAIRTFAYGEKTRLPLLKSNLGWARSKKYAFKGWATSLVKAYDGIVWKTDWAYVTAPVAAGKTLNAFAIWEVNLSEAYRITFNKNDGSGATKSILFAYGDKVHLPAVKNGLGWTRSGYTFKGWATSAANARAGKVWKGDWAYIARPVAKGQTLTVYAVWQ